MDRGRICVTWCAGSGHFRHVLRDIACGPNVTLIASATTDWAAVRGVRALFSSYAHLMKMFDEGWQIEPPVYVRPRWRSRLRLEKENTYHFVLWRGDTVNLVSVLDCPEVEQFLAENSLAVDRL